MRGTFNSTCDVFYGSRSLAGPPGVQYAAAVPCRLVPQTRIEQIEFAFALSSAWLTCDALDLNDPVVSSPYLGATFVDWLSADVVEVAAAPGVVWTVCREELVHPYAGAPYRRWLLIDRASVAYPPWLPPSPPPVPPPAVPGVACADAGVLSVGDHVVMSAVVTGVWYSWLATFTGTVHLETVSADVQLVIDVWYGACSGLNVVTAYVPSATPCIDFAVTAGTTYYFNPKSADGSAVSCDVQLLTGAC